MKNLIKNIVLSLFLASTAAPTVIKAAMEDEQPTKQLTKTSLKELDAQKIKRQRAQDKKTKFALTCPFCNITMLAEYKESLISNFNRHVKLCSTLKSLKNESQLTEENIEQQIKQTIAKIRRPKIPILNIKCPICSKCITFKTNLKKHLKKYHKGNSEAQKYYENSKEFSRYCLNYCINRDAIERQGDYNIDINSSSSLQRSPDSLEKSDDNEEETPQLSEDTNATPIISKRPAEINLKELADTRQTKRQCLPDYEKTKYTLVCPFCEQEIFSTLAIRHAKTNFHKQHVKNCKELKRLKQENQLNAEEIQKKINEATDNIREPEIIFSFKLQCFYCKFVLKSQEKSIIESNLQKHLKNQHKNNSKIQKFLNDKKEFKNYCDKNIKKSILPNPNFASNSSSLQRSPDNLEESGANHEETPNPQPANTSVASTSLKRPAETSLKELAEEEQEQQIIKKPRLFLSEQEKFQIDLRVAIENGDLREVKKAIGNGDNQADVNQPDVFNILPLTKALWKYNANNKDKANNKNTHDLALLLVEQGANIFKSDEGDSPLRVRAPIEVAMNTNEQLGLALFAKWFNRLIHKNISANDPDFHEYKIETFLNIYPILKNKLKKTIEKPTFKKNILGRGNTAIQSLVNIIAKTKLEQ